MLHGGFNSQVGLAKSFEVNPGDIFDIEVYAKYQDLGSTGSNYTALFNALVSAFSLSSSGGTGLEGQQAYNTFEGMFSAAPFIETNLDDDENAPKAYLNYILFDENFVLQDFGFDQIDASANQSAVHDYLSLHVKVEQKGYLYIYLSNENPTLVDVFFDDFKILHHTGVEQVSDFYAFGLQINSLGYQRPSATNNLYLYNGKESQSDIDASIYDYGARMYMSDIGRWGVVDPLAEVTYQISPFVYTYNNPINFIDPNGMLGVGAYGESLSNGAVSVWFNASPFTFEGAAYSDTESLQQAMLNSVMQDVAKGLVAPPDPPNNGVSKELSVAFHYGLSQWNAQRRAERRAESNRGGFFSGLGSGAWDGLKSTGKTLWGLATLDGDTYKELGQGLITLAELGSPFPNMTKINLEMATINYVKNIPNMSAYEIGFDLGLGIERIAEFALTRRVIPITKSSLGLKTLGDASRFTTFQSISTYGKLGRFSTPMWTIPYGAYTLDRATFFNRNFVIPVGRGVGIGSIRYFNLNEEN